MEIEAIILIGLVIFAIVNGLLLHFVQNRNSILEDYLKHAYYNKNNSKGDWKLDIFISFILSPIAFFVTLAEMNLPHLKFYEFLKMGVSYLNNS